MCSHSIWCQSKVFTIFLRPKMNHQHPTYATHPGWRETKQRPFAFSPAENIPEALQLKVMTPIRTWIQDIWPWPWIVSCLGFFSEYIYIYTYIVFISTHIYIYIVHMIIYVYMEFLYLTLHISPEKGAFHFWGCMLVYGVSKYLWYNDVRFIEWDHLKSICPSIHGKGWIVSSFQFFVLPSINLKEDRRQNHTNPGLRAIFAGGQVVFS